MAPNLLVSVLLGRDTYEDDVGSWQETIKGLVVVTCSQAKKVDLEEK